MRYTNVFRAAVAAASTLVLLLAGACGSKEPRKQKSKAGQHSRRTPRTPQARATEHPTLQEVEAKLQSVAEPTGGEVLAIVYAGGIRGEIEPCG